jgi:Cdc6-like AAA superfamily ATPase
MGKKSCYFVTANTSSGFVSFFDDVIKQSERVYIIKGGPGSGKSTFIKRIGEDLLSVGMSVDFIYSPEDRNSIEGIYVKDIRVAIINGTYPHSIDPVYPGAIERILDFSNFWDIDYLRLHGSTIKQLTDEIEKGYKTFFRHMKNAKSIHDRWEKEYLLGMDFSRADSITEDIISGIIEKPSGKNPKASHRFAGAMTPQGQVSFYNELTGDISRRYVMKGRPGTGKSTLTKKISAAALENGYDVEYYHCSFDVESIDMVIIPELDFALLDGTAPHVLDPIGDDVLVDMYECINTEIVKENENPIKSIQEEYAREIGKAKEAYSDIYCLHEKLENFYINATDFNDVNALRIRITKTLIDMRKE